MMMDDDVVAAVEVVKHCEAKNIGNKAIAAVQ